MKTRSYWTSSIVLVAVLAAFSNFANGQATQDQGAGQGQRRGRGQAPFPTANLPFDAHDFNGVWMGRGPFNTLSNKPPTMTPWAQARYDAAKPGIGPRAQPLGNDPMMACDPIGYPRIAY